MQTSHFRPRPTNRLAVDKLVSIASSVCRATQAPDEDNNYRPLTSRLLYERSFMSFERRGADALAQARCHGSCPDRPRGVKYSHDE
jgi:hypothetical protein